MNRADGNNAAPEPNNTQIAGRVVGGLALVAVLASVVGVIISGASYEAPPEGLPDSGPVVAWLIPIMGALGFVSAMATVGWLLFAGFLDPNLGKETVSHAGRKALIRVSIAAAIWCLVSLVAAVLTLANILGVPAGTALSPNVFTTYAWAVEDVRTLLVSALLAAVVAVGALVSVRLKNVTVWLAIALVAVAAPATAGHATGLGDHSMAVVASVTHALAATIWVGGVIALASSIRAKSAARAVAIRRFSLLAMTAVVLLAASGIVNAYVRLAEFGDLFSSGYGRLVLIKAILLVCLILLATRLRKYTLPAFEKSATVRTFTQLVLVELGVMGVAAGLGVALSQTAPTRASIQFASQGEILLGFPFPAPPTVMNVVLGWDFDILFLTLSVLAIVYYLLGVRRLRKRGVKWPVPQTISWVVGWLIVAWATNSGIATYSEVSVGLHMIQHMTLTMMAPIFIVLAAPVTLALRALHPSPTGGRGPRELLMSGLHSRLAVFFTNPIVILGIYVVGLYGLYMTDLFGTLMSSHVGHIGMTLHFLLSGILLAYVAIGVDPKPRPLPYWGRMLLVLTAIVLHTFFALALMSATTVIGANWFSLVRPPWLVDPVRDSMLGGQIAWGVAEIPTVVMLLIIGIQWSRSDKRESTRRDRKTKRRDLELDEYNAYLKYLNERAIEHEEKNRNR